MPDSHSSPQASTRRLALALDGVPWQAIDEIRDSGAFRLFHPPARVVSPFPTMTNIGMNAMLGARKTLGYENLFFDREKGRMRGGAMKYIKRRSTDAERRGYNCLLDYEEPMQYEFLVYILPDKIFASDLSRMIDRFKRSSAPVFFAFLKSTDGIIHLGGREKLMKVLAQLDSTLSQLYEDCRGELEILMFSDHGNALVPFERVSLKPHLARYGFELSSRIKTHRSVIVPGFGLCSYAPVYTAAENRRELSEAIAELKGVDFCVFRPVDDESATEIIGPRGRARIHSERGGFLYDQIEGDPLRLSRIIASLRSEGLIDQRGFAEDRVWFEATKDHTYPDALRNLWSSARDHVESTADVLVSFEDGYCYGSAIFDLMVTMLATHGSALKTTSYSFLMSTHRDFASHLRAREASLMIRAF
ncbi:MAG: hypothetical protein AB1631_11065 [Acidobacteriota bacterium]